MAASTLSRRVSEFIGVALFAAALLSFISLASYSASDPVWFFNTGGDMAYAAPALRWRACRTVTESRSGSGDISSVYST